MRKLLCGGIVLLTAGCAGSDSDTYVALQADLEAPRDRAANDVPDNPYVSPAARHVGTTAGIETGLAETFAETGGASVSLGYRRGGDQAAAIEFAMAPAAGPLLGTVATPPVAHLHDPTVAPRRLSFGSQSKRRDRPKWRVKGHFAHGPFAMDIGKLRSVVPMRRGNRKWHLGLSYDGGDWDMALQSAHAVSSVTKAVQFGGRYKLFSNTRLAGGLQWVEDDAGTGAAVAGVVGLQVKF